MATEIKPSGSYTISYNITCNGDSDTEDLRSLRISAIFVILVGALFGAVFPIVAARYPGLRGQKRVFFIVKYFGSGVIVATAFIHLLAPANEALSSPCLNSTVTGYPWAEGIALMSVFSLFFVELLATSFATFSGIGQHGHDDDGHSHGHSHSHSHSLKKRTSGGTSLPGEDHMSHVRKHQDLDVINSRDGRTELPASIANASSYPASSGLASPLEPVSLDEEAALQAANEDYASQMISIFIFEFGVVFHSVIIGLTLAVTGNNFKTLYIVLVFHQTFEGLALGTRLAVVSFPKSRRLTPYIMAVAYGLSTPLATAIGLAARKSYSADSSTALLVQGVFDATSAGILLYTGLIELMAHEFLFSETFRPVKRGRRARLFAAFGCMVLGAALMAVLGYWA